jgi:hypothetical protein
MSEFGYDHAKAIALDVSNSALYPEEEEEEEEEEESFWKMCTFSKLRKTPEESLGVINIIWNHVPKVL